MIYDYCWFVISEVLVIKLSVVNTDLWYLKYVFIRLL
jgi:hypothetical protein